MKVHTVLTDLNNGDTVICDNAQLTHTPKGGRIITMEDGRLVWKLLKEGILIENTGGEGNVKIVLRRSGASRAQVELSGCTIEMPVRLIRWEEQENSWEVEYELEDSQEVFAFSLKIIDPLETEEDIR